jgi:molybdopterin-guanine dinucleotide biosynthesis protein A
VTQTIRRDTVVGLLLAGGQSRRMASAFGAEAKGDKGLLDLAGKPMLAHVIERLKPQVSALVINANGDPGRFKLFGLPVVPDTIEGYAGPLAGILAGLKWCGTNAPSATHVVSVSTDAPFLPLNLVEKLGGALEAGPGKIALAASNGEVHPVIGLWPVGLADDLERSLYQGMRKVRHWTNRHGTLPVEFPFTEVNGHKVDPFFNANTPEELDEARRLLHM